MYLLFVLTVLLILYGSLYPFQFVFQPLAAGPFWHLLHSWPSSGLYRTASDVVLNIVLYVPVGLFGVLALDRMKRSFPRWFLPLACGVVLSASVEMLQLFDAYRVCSTLDWIDNIAGTMLGIGVALAFRSSKGGRRILDIAQHAPRSALVLVSFWLTYLIFPTFPIVSGHPLLGKARAALDFSHLSLLELITATLAWLSLAFLLQTIERRSRPHLLILFALLAPARLLFGRRGVSSSELIGIVAALLVIYSPLWKARGFHHLLAYGMLALLLVRGLAPFHLQAQPGTFSWTPLGATLRADRQFAFVTLMQKAFYYGVTIWLLRESGWSLLRATLVVATLLAALEAVQRYLPGRTAEVTDPLLALLAGGIFAVLRLRRKAALAATPG